MGGGEGEKMKKQKKFFMFVLSVLALCLFAFPMTASAQSTWYVSPTGDDGNAGSEASPWRTITHAVSEASGGDTIMVMDDDDVNTDDYIENITVDKSLTIERYDNSGANPQVKALGTWSPVFNVTADNVIIRGLDIYYGATGSGKAGIYLHGVTGCTIEDNRCGWDDSHNNNDGICLYFSSNNTLTGNTANSNNDKGIYLSSSSNNVFTGNTANENNDTGIFLGYSSNNNTLYLNNLSNNTAANAYVYSSSGNIWNSPTMIYYEYTSGSFHKNYLGNYYSDYGGSDDDGDGIGDMDYSGTGMTDSYPLKETPDRYSLQAWWLHSDSIMYRDDRTKSPGSVTLSGSGSHIWIADQVAFTDIDFSGTDTWTGQLVFTLVLESGDNFTVEMGSSTNGTDFTAGGPDATITGDGSATVFTYETDASAFTVTTGEYLALRITNNSSSSYDVQTGGAWSYCSSPDGSTDYIVPTEPIAGSDVTKLFNNYPNPAKSTTTIKYQLKGNVMEQDAIINIYNIRGQLVKTAEGKGGVALLDVSDLVNGIYFYRLEAGERTFVKKMVIMR